MWSHILAAVVVHIATLHVCYHCS